MLKGPEGPVTPEELEEMDGSELVTKWRDQNKVWCLEGDGGLEKLEKLFKVLGYGHQFRFGDPIQAFLSDCSGACEALVDYLAEEVDRNEEWKEAFKQSIDVIEEEEEEDGSSEADGDDPDQRS